MESGVGPNKDKDKIIEYCKCKLTMESAVGPNKDKYKKKYKKKIS